MPVNAIDQFKFSQYYVQDDGGWCSGISVAVITHLYENLGTTSKYVTPKNAYAQTEGYVSLLKGTYNKITGETALGGQVIRDPIHDLQRPFDFGTLPFISSGRPTGSYEYNFDTPGTALVNLVVREPPDTNYGSDFLSWYSSDGKSNHAGVAVWYPSGEVFLFDPNCGGLRFTWQGLSFPAAVDMALEHMYTTSDRKRGARVAKLVSAQRLDSGGLPFGKV